MAGTIVVESGGGGQAFPAKLTFQVIVATILAAFGGFMFGYDTGVSGGVSSMNSFLKEFFPTVYVKKHQAKSNNYCKYDNQLLQLFTSSLYFGAIAASFVASIITRRFGRRSTIRAASVLFIIGAIFNAVAKNLAMLIIGRIFLGAGIGFGNQAVPLFISEIAPARYRGSLNICFQLMITLGILTANLVNYYTSKRSYGWRISLGAAAMPGLVLLIGSIMIVETPVSLIQRGKKEEGLLTLRKIRGVENVDEEYEEIVRATEVANQVKNSFRNLCTRPNRPPLTCTILIQFFQQFTGINTVLFYSPLLFQTMGLGDNASLLSALLVNTVKPTGTIVALLVVDRVGRRKLLMEAAVQMLICQCAIGFILAEHLKQTNFMPKNYAVTVIIFICIFLAGFAWSWGPLGWLIPSEIFPLETRSAGLFVNVSANMFATFLIAQTFLTMLCHLRAGIFFFFAAWILIMGLFALFLLPETKGIPIEEMTERAWKNHWFWKRYYKDDAYDDTYKKPNKEIQDKQ